MICKSQKYKGCRPSLGQALNDISHVNGADFGICISVPRPEERNRKVAKIREIQRLRALSGSSSPPGGAGLQSEERGQHRRK